MNAYPRLTEGLAFIPVADGYVVEGGQRRQTLTGPLARDVLPVLLPLLDGSRTACELGLPPALVSALVRLGLVRLLDRPWTPDPEDSALRVCLRRSFPPERADGVWRRLRASRVAVVGRHRLCGLIAAVLTQSGVEVGPGSLTIAVNEPGVDAVLHVSAGSSTIALGRVVPDAGADCSAALAGAAAGTIAGIALRLLGGHGPVHRDVQVVESGGRVRVIGPPVVGAGGASSRYLTERRLPLPAWLRGLPAPPGAVRLYVRDGAASYFADPIARELVELAGSGRPGGDGPAVVLTCPATRASTGVEAGIEAGITLAELAAGVRARGLRARARRPPRDGSLDERLDLDPERERVAVVVELSPGPRAARPVRRPATSAFAERPLDGRRLARLIERARSAAEEIHPDALPRWTLYARRVTGVTADSPPELERYLDGRGMSPAAVLLFADGPDLIGAGLAAGTVRLLAGRAGIAAALLADQGLYGCALGYAASSEPPAVAARGEAELLAEGAAEVEGADEARGRGDLGDVQVRGLEQAGGVPHPGLADGAHGRAAGLGGEQVGEARRRQGDRTGQGRDRVARARLGGDERQRPGDPRVARLLPRPGRGRGQHQDLLERAEHQLPRGSRGRDRRRDGVPRSPLRVGDGLGVAGGEAGVVVRAVEGRQDARVQRGGHPGHQVEPGHQGVRRQPPLPGGPGLEVGPPEAPVRVPGRDPVVLGRPGSQHDQVAGPGQAGRTRLLDRAGARLRPHEQPARRAGRTADRVAGRLVVVAHDHQLGSRNRHVLSGHRHTLPHAGSLP
nr:hypothetical protein [Nonomuraea sediminis]